MDSNGKGNGIVRRTIMAGALGLALVGLLALSAQARGPGRGGREFSPDRAAARMAERLDLKAEQQSQVRKILDESLAKRGEIREEGRKKMEALREETDKRLSGVLTPEQMTRLRALREERGERRGDCGMRPGGPERGFPGEPPPEDD